MDKWEIKPLISVGPIKFGMSRKDLHDLFEEKCKEFKGKNVPVTSNNV